MWRWVILALSLLATAVLTVYAATFDTSEFRGLGFLFVHMLVFTPLLLIAPLSVHFRAPAKFRKRLWFLNVLAVLGLAMSWIVLLSR
jgi:hypothetical protein